MKFPIHGSSVMLEMFFFVFLSSSTRCTEIHIFSNFPSILFWYYLFLDLLYSGSRVVPLSLSSSLFCYLGNCFIVFHIIVFCIYSHHIVLYLRLFLLTFLLPYTSSASSKIHFLIIYHVSFFCHGFQYFLKTIITSTIFERYFDSFCNANENNYSISALFQNVQKRNVFICSILVV